jgi:hypothetical protein
MAVLTASVCGPPKLPIPGCNLETKYSNGVPYVKPRVGRMARAALPWVAPAEHPYPDGIASECRRPPIRETADSATQTDKMDPISQKQVDISRIRDLTYGDNKNQRRKTVLAYRRNLRNN